MAVSINSIKPLSVLSKFEYFYSSTNSEKRKIKLYLSKVMRNFVENKRIRE